VRLFKVAHFLRSSESFHRCSGDPVILLVIVLRSPRFLLSLGGAQPELAVAIV
jgi:hypothetical protein